MVRRITVGYETRERGPVSVLLAEVEPDATDFQLAAGNVNRGSTRDITVPIHVFCNAGRSGSGVHARGVFVTWQNEPPAGYKAGGSLFIPVFRTFLYDISKIHSLATYKGVGCIIIGKRPEVIR